MAKAVLCWIVIGVCDITLVGLSQFQVEGKVVAKRMSERVVTTQYGKLRGVLFTLLSKNLPDVEGYLGLQYASILGGELRFMPPTSPMETWDGIRVAMKFRPVCPQRIPTEQELSAKLPMGRVDHFKRLLPFLERQAEECLNLNVYVPVRADNSSGLMPVLLFIHGENYDIGTGNAYDGSALASYGKIVVVTLNYRLGVLGFLSTGDSHAPGNYALLDQVAALHWIKENIAAFGGDPQHVTLLGQGYGGTLVNLLLISPVTKGRNLFKRAIIQSGSALSSWAISQDPLRYTQELADKVNCSHYWGRSDRLLHCFKLKPYEELVSIAMSSTKYLTSFGPVIDHRSVLPRDIERLLRKPHSVFGDVNLLLGVMKNEGFLYFNQQEIDVGVTAHKRDRMIRTYVRNVYRYHRQKIYEILLHHYTDWERPSDPTIIRDNLMELLGDGQFVSPMIQLSKYHAQYPASTYFYSFSYPSRLDSYPRWAGGVHGDDMTYIFGAPLADGIDPFTTTFTRSERMLTEAVMRYWVNFIKTGDPNEPQRQESVFGGRVKNRFVDLRWPTYDNTRQEYMHIGECLGALPNQADFEQICQKDGMRPTVRHHYRGSKMALWLDLIPSIHQSDDLEPRHHLLENYGNMSTFEEDGTEPLDMTKLFPPPPIPPSSPPSSTTTTPTTTSTTSPTTTTTTVIPTTTERFWYQTRARTPRYGIERPPTTPFTERTTEEPEAGAFSTKNSTLSLSVTIAVGCSLLFLNIMIFAGVYYQKDRMRMEMKARQRELEKEKSGEDSSDGGPRYTTTCIDADCNMATLPAPPPAISRHQVQPQVASIPKQPIPVLPPQAPYATRTYGARELQQQRNMRQNESPRHHHTVPRNPNKMMNNKPPDYHSNNPDSDINTHSNPVTVV